MTRRTIYVGLVAACLSLCSFTAAAQQCLIADSSTTPPNLRQSPNGAVLRSLQNGLPVIVLREDGNWKEIADYSSKMPLGWVWGKSIFCQPPYLTREKLIPIASGLLAEAGITNYKFLPAQADEANASWVYEDGDFGELFVLRPGAGITAQEIANTTIQRQAKLCKGEFASARLKSRFFKGSEIQVVMSHCSTGRAGQPISTHLSIVELPSGAILRFGNTVVGAQVQARSDERRVQVENAGIHYVSSNGDRMR